MKTESLLGMLQLAAAALLAVPTLASATILASDNFESYSTAAIAGQNGGTGWAAAWTETAAGNPSKNVVDTSGSPLTYAIPGGQTVDGATRAVEVQMPGTSTAGLLQRQLASPLSQTYYVGYLVRYVGSAGGTWAGGNNTFTLHLGTDATTTGSTLNFGLRGDTGGGGTANEFIMRVGTGGPVAGASTGGQLTNDSTYFLVCEYTWGGTGFTSAKMWLDPTLSDITDTPAGDASLTFATPIAATTHVFWRATVWQNDDIVRVDELKIGTAWVDVVPPAGPPVPQVSVETKADGTGVVVPAQTVTAGNSITNYAIVRDGSGNFLSNSVASWSAVNVTGGIGSGDIVIANGGRSAVFTGHLVGTANLRATPPTGATVYNDSGLITVQAAAASQVRVETQPDGSGTVVPAQSVAPPGGTLTVYSISRDAFGNFLGNISATWSLQNKTSGVVDGDLSPTSGTSSTFTGNLSGTANIRATSGALTSVYSGLITVSRAMTWVGGGANNWDFTSANWTGAGTTFLDSDDVTFDGQNPAVNITTTVKPHSINIVAGEYTFGGSGGISGVSSLTNASGSRLVLLTTNDYSGFTVVSFGSTLQLGDGVKNGSFGAGTVRIETGGTSPVFNRTDPVASPYVVSNTISGPSADFLIEVKSGAVKLAGNGANSHATAVVRNGATLILGKNVGGGAALGNNTWLAAIAPTPLLNIEAGGTVKLDSAVTDHITGAGKMIQIDGTFDVNGYPEAFGIIQGNGVIDNTGTSNAVLTVNQGSTDVANGGVGQGGEVYTFGGLIRNTGAGLLGLTKDSTNTLILTSANTYGGDTRIVGGGILELGNLNSMQQSTLDYRTADTGKLSFGNLTTATLGGLKGAKVLGLTNTSGAAVALTIGGNGQTNTFSGVISEGGSLTKTGSGIQTLSGTNTYSGNTAVSQGTLLVNGALANGSVNVASGAALGGTGTIGGATTIQNGARLVPGNNNIGKLTVNSTITLSGTTIMEINRSFNAPTNCDVLAATTLNLGGSLTVTNRGPALKSGDTFTLFSGVLAGSIAPGTLPSLAPGLSWNTSSLNSAGVISVTGTELAPQITGVGISGTNFVMSGTGGVEGSPYYVLSSTNVALPLASWTRTATNLFGTGGNYTAIIPMAPGESQRFLTIQVP